MTNNMRRWGAAALAGSGLCAITAPAIALPPPPYAVVDLAHSLIGMEATEIQEAGLQPTGSDRRATGYGITLGWRFSPHLGVEGTFIDLGEARFDVEFPSGPAVSNGKIGVRSSGLLLSLAGTWPIHDRLSVEGRAGAYFGRTETRVRGAFTGPFGNQEFSNLLGTDSKVGVAAGVGAVASINDTWAVRAGYDFVDTAFGNDAGRISLGVRFNWP